MSRSGRRAILVLLVGALVASLPMLASNNLLPRRLCLHAFAFACLWATLLRRVRLHRTATWLLGELVLVTAISPLRVAALPGLIDALAAVAIVVGLGSMPLRRLTILRVLVAVSVIGSIAGLAEQWVALPLGDVTRPAGLFASRATAGALVAAVIPLSCLVCSRRPWLLGLALTVQEVFLISTRARAAWVAAACVVVVLCLRAPRWRVALATSAVAAGLLAALLTPGPLLSWKIDQPYLASLADVATLRLGDRLDVWAETARLAMSRPWGSGVGTFEASFAARAKDLPSTLAGVRIESPHNEPLRLLFEIGLPGVALLAFAFRPRRAGASIRTAALWCSLLALGLTSLTGKTLTDPPTLAVSAVVAGLVLRTRRESSPLGVTVALTCALGFGILGVDAPMIAASRDWARARTAAASGDTRAALDTITPALAASNDLGAWLWAIDLAAEARDLRRCTRLCEAALDTFPGSPLLEARRRDCR